MRTFECSREAPWGIHLSLLESHCPRCGWEAPKPKSPGADREFGWMPLGLMVPASSASLPV
jgi:hypothetical protein